jgi:hypothetical protein
MMIHRIDTQSLNGSIDLVELAGQWLQATEYSTGKTRGNPDIDRIQTTENSGGSMSTSRSTAASIVGD